MASRNAQLPIERPIFVLGTGRCGSTVFHEVFSQHPRVAFLTRLNDLHPRRSTYNRVALGWLDAPLIGGWLRRKLPPSEAWTFWREHVTGFDLPCRDLRADDVLPDQAAAVRGALAAQLTAARSRLLIKLTGWSRIGWLDRVFPDATFVHVVRDGRAVVNSLLNVGFWRGWQGPDQWRWGPLTAEERREWSEAGESFVVLAAIQYRKILASFERARRAVPEDRYLEVRYEDFASGPRASFEQVLDRVGLDYPAAFRDAVGGFRLKSQNFKWQEQLTEAQQHELEQSLRPVLDRYGYS